jgi:hypothetical protein
MAAGRYSFVIEQGATTNINVQWNDADDTPISLEGCHARMHIRPDINSSDILLSLTSSLNPNTTCLDGLLLSGSDGITLVQSGSIGIVISAYSSSILNFNEAYYDLEIVNGCEVTRLLEGKVKLSKNVTR